MTIYLSMILINLGIYLSGKKSYVIVILTSVFLFFLMSGHEYTGEGDAIDFLGYYRGYTLYNELPQTDFWYYYLFNIFQKIGHLLSLNFYQWWALMTILALTFIFVTIKKRRLNPHLFLFFFMIYHVFLFYGGLKFFYGFCIYQYAFSFLLTGESKDKKKYIVWTLIAGGFHIMYYIFLIFIFVDPQKKKRVMKWFATFMIIFTGINFLSGSNLVFIQNFINSLESERLTIYFSGRTNLGFLLPIGIHILTTYYTYYYRKIIYSLNLNKNIKIYSDYLFYINLMAIIFYPLFLVALTFMRLLTSLSITTIISTGFYQHKFNQMEKLKLLGCGLLIIALFYFINVYLSGYWEKTMLPFFDSYYFNWIIE